MEKGIEQDNRCVSCGAIIPEGLQVCQNCEKGSPLMADTGNPYYDYLVHEVQVVCNCPKDKAMAVVSYVNSLGSNPLDFIKKLPEYVGEQHPDVDEVLKALEAIREREGVQRYGICFPEGYANRKERRRREKETRRRAKELRKEALRNGRC